MNLIINNPCRILGVLAGVPAKEQERQIRRLKKYIEAEQETPVDYSFPILGALHRTIESISDAASKLNLDSDKINAALFWFYKGNDTADEASFDALKNRDLYTAINIWTKQTETDEVTERNASAFQNLSTLLLSDIADESNLQQGIIMKLKFLESDFVKDFKSVTTDATFKISKKELQLMFLNSIVTDDEVTISEVVSITKFIDFSAQQDFLKSIAQKFTGNITAQIDIARKQRTADKSKATNAG